ncbi:hypothetical protein AVEN_243006-1 [Araneus ventricosus]|uniref:Uncharacterized protein n=1 Tax=Araneus ventricosus TaxID=182803 RepID=A0A4Y2D2Y7_ARAVE|nr:hypothetical protein AVEN_243006-1 [Araneus ventricosus]
MKHSMKKNKDNDNAFFLATWYLCCHLSYFEGYLVCSDFTTITILHFTEITVNSQPQPLLSCIKSIAASSNIFDAKKTNHSITLMAVSPPRARGSHV